MKKNAGNGASDLRKIFADNLNKYMREKGITQTDIVEKLGVTSSTASDWCNGNKYPRVDKMQKLAELFDIYMSDLTDDKSTEIEESLTPQMKEALNIFESLPPHLQEAALLQLRALGDASKKKDTE